MVGFFVIRKFLIGMILSLLLFIESAAKLLSLKRVDKCFRVYLFNNIYDR